MSVSYAVGANALAVSTGSANAAPTSVFSVAATPTIPATPAFPSGYPGPSQIEGTPSVADDFKNQQGAAPTQYFFAITRTGDTSQAQSVSWAVRGIAPSPADGADFLGGVLQTGTVTFQPGDTELLLSVFSTPDFTPEGNDTFNIVLSNPTDGGGLAADPTSGAMTIRNDDVPTSIGTSGDDTIDLHTQTAPVFVDASQGGNDTVTGGSGNDVFYFGGAFTAADTVNGGNGRDVLVLDGDYSTALKFGTANLNSVEDVFLSAGHSYNLVLNKATVAAGGNLNIDASAVSYNNTVTIDARAVAGGISFLGGFCANVALGGNGDNLLIGGAFDDVLTGGKGNDTIIGGGAADILTGGKGNNVFVYNSASDSPLLVTAIGGTIFPLGGDQLVGFQTKADKIDLTAFKFGTSTETVVTQSKVGFTQSVVAGNHFFVNGTAQAGVVVEYAAKGPSVGARIYVDANHDGSLNAGDMMINATQVGYGKITGSNFIFGAAAP